MQKFHSGHLRKGTAIIIIKVDGYRPEPNALTILNRMMERRPYLAIMGEVNGPQVDLGLYTLIEGYQMLYPLQVSWWSVGEELWHLPKFISHVQALPVNTVIFAGRIQSEQLIGGAALHSRAHNLKWNVLVDPSMCENTQDMSCVIEMPEIQEVEFEL